MRISLCFCFLVFLGCFSCDLGLFSYVYFFSGFSSFNWGFFSFVACCVWLGSMGVFGWVFFLVCLRPVCFVSYGWCYFG